MAWDKASFDVAFVYGGLGITAPPNANDPKNRPASLTLKRTADIGTQYTNVDAVLKIGGAFGTVKVKVSGTLNAQDAYEFPGATLAGTLLSTFGSTFGPETTNPPYTMTTTATLTFKTAAGDTLPGDRTSQSLTINWIKGPRCCTP
jgi:hypothetical protein